MSWLDIEFSHFFNLIQILVFSDIYHVFISQILGDLNIKNSNYFLPIMLSASLFCLDEKSSKGNVLFLKGNILSRIL